MTQQLGEVGMSLRVTIEDLAASGTAVTGHGGAPP